MKKIKVYFDGSLAGLKEYRENYKKVIAVLEKNDCQVSQLLFRHTRNSYQALSYRQGREIYKKIISAVSECDFMVAEMTFGSPSLAMIIQEAIYRHKKPVLVLFHESKKGRPGAAFSGHPSQLLYLKKYSFNTLDKIIKEFIKRIKNRIQAIKFTVRLDVELDNYLAYRKLKDREVSKNQIILNILRQSLGNDKGYSRFLKNK